MAAGFSSKTMVSSPSDRLGVHQILWESIRLPIKSGQLFPPLLLLSLLSSCLLFYCYYSIAPIPLDLVAKVSILLKETKHRPPNLLSAMEQDLKEFAGIASAVALFFFASSLLLILATTYTFAMAYTGSNLTPQALLFRVALRWYQTMVTRLYVVFLTIGVGVLSTVGVGTVMLVSGGSRAGYGVGVSLAFVAAFLYLYLLTRWSMSLVITAVEQTWGIGALSLSVELYIGNKKRGTTITLMLLIVKVAIYGAFVAVVRAAGPESEGAETPMVAAYVAAAADAVWDSYSMAVYTVFYYECRKSHGLMEHAGLSAVPARISIMAN